MNPYLTLKEKHQKEINEFPLGFCFNDQQYNEMMANWGLTPEDTDKIYSIGGGGYIRKSDSKAMNEMFDRHEREVAAARAENKDDYLYHMFNYELANHEYGYTYDATDTLAVLDLTMEEIEADERMLEAFKRAIKNQENNEW